MRIFVFLAILISLSISVVHAHTSVTLYGALDGNRGYQRLYGTVNGARIDARKIGGVNGIGLQAGNKWGLKGSEDLGNGLHAIFWLESGFNLDDGYMGQGGRLFGRVAIMGLSHESIGEVTFGRQTNIASKYIAEVIDPFKGGFLQANAGTSFSSANTMRWDNMVMYQSAKIGGLQVGAGYSFNVDGPQGSDVRSSEENFTNPADWNGKGLTLGLRYSYGSLGLVATYDRIKFKKYNYGVTNPYPINNDDKAFTEWTLGAAYDFDFAKATVAFGQTKNGWFGGTSFGFNITTGSMLPANGLKVNSYLVGLEVPIASGKLLASWQLADPRNAAKTEQPYSGDLHGQQTYSLGYYHPLSKRTNVYVIAAHTNHVIFQKDLKANMVGIGLRHQF